LLVKRSIVLWARTGSAKVASHSSRPAIRRHDDRPGAIALEEQVVEVATLDGVEDIDGKVIEDEEVDGDQLPEFGFKAVVEPRVLEGLAHLIGADREDGGAAPARDVAEGVSEKGLADADGPDDRDVGMRVEEAQGRELIEEGAIEGDLGAGGDTAPVE
jgi:hypothetical protein